MRHTPGPWIAGKDLGCKGIWGPPHPEFPSELQEIATTPGLANEEEDLANARLIAAAPDLLAALKGLLPAFSYDADPEKGYAGEVLVAIDAIAKASPEAEGEKG